MKCKKVKLIVLIVWPVVMFAAAPWIWGRVRDYGVSEVVFVIVGILSFVVLMLALASLFYAVGSIIEKK